MTTERNDEGYYSNNGKISNRNLSKELINELKIGLRLGKKLQKRVFRQTMGRL